MDDLPQLNGLATVVLLVNGQAITISVNGNEAPITAGNYVDLVERRVYDGVMFHRVVREPTPFVVQGGDPRSQDPSIPANQLGTGGFIDPATGQRRNIPLEIKPVGADEPIYGQTLASAGITAPPVLPHTPGAVAMARATAPNSGSSQFYFALQDLPSLDGNYAVFGYVTAGFDVVDRVQQGDRIQVARITDGIIPGRASAFLEVGRLNTFINAMNRTSVLGGGPNFTQGADTLILVESSDADLRGARALNGNDQVTGSSSYDVIQGNQGNDTLTGLGGDDFLRGGKDNDLLLGGEGNDTLIGDRGTDTLTGGPGNDTFIFRVETTDGPDITLADRVTDFGSGDRIAIAGDVGLSGLRFRQVGSDAVISLNTGDVLGVILGSSASAVQAATVIVPLSDSLLAIG
ncbi:peptidylprolyl isomerase [Trichothermofontia sp.]